MRNELQCLRPDALKSPPTEVFKAVESPMQGSPLVAAKRAADCVSLARDQFTPRVMPHRASDRSVNSLAHALSLSVKANLLDLSLIYPFQFFGSLIALASKPRDLPPCPLQS